MVSSWANCEQEEIEDSSDNLKATMPINRNQDLLLNLMRKLEINTSVSDSDNLSSEI
jgi:hypothetical protein